MFSSCDFCLASSDTGVVLIILPCGYTLCLSHLDQLENSFECLICKSHIVKKDDCFSMNKNRSILKKLEYNDKESEFQERLDAFMTLKNGPRPFLDKNVNNLIDSINYQKEFLKSEISKQIDSYAEKLIESVSKTNLQYEAKIGACLDSIDLSQCEQFSGESSCKRFRADNEIKYLEEKMELIDQKKDLLEIKLNEIAQYFAEFATLRLVVFDKKKFIVENLFGHLELDSKFETKNDVKNVINSNENLPPIPNFNELKNIVTVHAKQVWCIDELSTGELVAGSDDRTIKIVDMKSGQIIRELIGHDNLILDVKVGLNDTIFSSSNDGTIKIWTKNGECIRTIEHKVPVNCIELWNEKLISGDENGEIVLWNKDTGLQIKKIKAHARSIFCFKFFDKNLLLTGSSDQKIKLWNLETGVCVKEFNGHIAQVLFIEKLNDFEFISGSDDETCRVWNITSGRCTLTLKKNFKCVPSFIALQNNNFLSCSTDGFVRLWDRNLGKWTSKFHQQKNVQYIKLLKSGELICCTENSYLSVWK